ncbi:MULTISPECIES: ATP-binding protein [unclassified Streptomyces]|uniref:ATP-binding protein n=1 Tax=unclassified Streptomyces TaxID=2593676 RepID=UPI00081D831A|nr:MULTISPECIES: ATP-binding protein [unclassified Streptomyces]MYZ36199.1 ATP-binding protein [Streptomyces sp. SID4917]SCF81681.1 Anti-sigma regulatory factor (Ser/Thr protein kinase) [Streptomyces sp. MnatMP-M17]
MRLNRHGSQTDGSVVLRWSSHPRCVALARLELRKALAGWGLAELEDSALIVLSELLTNAGRHAQVVPEQTIETYYFRRPAGLRIEVYDASPELPCRRPAGPEASCGRGLVLVEALADEWGVIEHGGGRGKTVWAALSLPNPNPNAGAGEDKGGRERG